MHEPLFTNGASKLATIITVFAGLNVARQLFFEGTLFVSTWCFGCTIRLKTRRKDAILEEEDSLHATMDLGGTTIPAEPIKNYSST